MLQQKLLMGKGALATLGVYTPGFSFLLCYCRYTGIPPPATTSITIDQ